MSANDRPDPPPARCGLFERVVVVADRPGGDDLGREGAVVWRDRPCYNRRLQKWGEWAYCVCFAPEGRYRAFRESALEPTGRFDPPDAHRGREFEVSYDTALHDAMETVEGSFRAPGSFWRVFVVSRGDVATVTTAEGAWESGITGLEFEVPRESMLDHGFIVNLLTRAVGPGPWREVRGPDSMMLK